MEHSWSVFKDGKVTFTTRLKLSPTEKGRKVIWQWTKPQGHWDYIEVPPLLLMEFYGGTYYRGEPLRRHAFAALDDTSFQLLENRHPIYEEIGLWTEESIVHFNDSTVMLQRIRQPLNAPLAAEFAEAEDRAEKAPAEAVAYVG